MAPAATSLALQRIGAGLGDRVSPVDLDGVGQNVSEVLKVELGAELAVQVEVARAVADAIIRANVEPIRRFAEALAEAGELTGGELRRAIEAARFMPAEEIR